MLLLRGKINILKIYLGFKVQVNDTTTAIDVHDSQNRRAITTIILIAYYTHNFENPRQPDSMAIRFPTLTAITALKSRNSSKSHKNYFV